MYEYVGKHVSFITLSTYQPYLRALAEFSPEHLLCFEVVAVSPRGKSSPSVALFPFAHAFHSLDGTVPPAHVVCAYVLLNREWSHGIIQQQFTISIKQITLMDTSKVIKSTELEQINII